MLDVKNLHNAFEKHSLGKSMEEFKIKLGGVFTSMTKLIIENRTKMGLNDLKLYLHLLQRCFVKSKVFYTFPSYKTLQTSLALQSTQISNGIKKLTAMGLIMVIKNYGSHALKFSNVYVLMELVTQSDLDLFYILTLNSILNTRKTDTEILADYETAKSMYLSTRKSLKNNVEARKLAQIGRIKTKAEKEASLQLRMEIAKKLEQKRNVPEKTPPE